MNRITGSRYWLARICPSAFTGGWAWEEGTSYASRAGSALHMVAAHLHPDSPHTVPSLIEQAIAKYTLTPGAQSRDLKLQVSHLVRWLETQEAMGWVREVGYYLDLDTMSAGRLEMNYERDYTKAPVNAIAMSLDAMEIRQGGTGMVLDWKTGYWTDAPEYSEQLKVASLAISRAHGLREVTARIVKVRAKEGVIDLTHTFAEMDLDIVESEVADVFAAVKLNPPPQPGEHCKRCPAKQSCPASTAKKEAA